MPFPLLLIISTAVAAGDLPPIPPATNYDVLAAGTFVPHHNSWESPWVRSLLSPDERAAIALAARRQMRELKEIFHTTKDLVLCLRQAARIKIIPVFGLPACILESAGKHANRNRIDPKCMTPPDDIRKKLEGKFEQQVKEAKLLLASTEHTYLSNHAEAMALLQNINDRTKAQPAISNNQQASIGLEQVTLEKEVEAYQAKLAEYEKDVVFYREHFQRCASADRPASWRAEAQRRLAYLTQTGKLEPTTPSWIGHGLKELWIDARTRQPVAVPSDPAPLRKWYADVVIPAHNRLHADVLQMKAGVDARRARIESQEAERAKFAADQAALRDSKLEYEKKRAALRDLLELHEGVAKFLASASDAHYQVTEIQQMWIDYLEYDLCTHPDPEFVMPKPKPSLPPKETPRQHELSSRPIDHQTPLVASHVLTTTAVREEPSSRAIQHDSPLLFRPASARP